MGSLFPNVPKEADLLVVSFAGAINMEWTQFPQELSCPKEPALQTCPCWREEEFSDVSTQFHHFGVTFYY